MCWSSSHDDPANCTIVEKVIFLFVFLLLLVNNNMKIVYMNDALTLSFALKHQCSNSCKPAFTYSPLLNEQHSRRSSKLQNSHGWNLGEWLVLGNFQWVLFWNVFIDLNGVETDRDCIPVKKLNIYEWEYLTEDFSCYHGRDLKIAEVSPQTLLISSSKH